jgi:RNA polymerase primary sigma factor
VNSQQPLNVIDAVNRVVRTSRQMALEIHREPTPEELANRLAIPVEEVKRLLAIARTPVRLDP